MSLDLLKRAQEEARGRNQPCVTSLHLLLAFYHIPHIKGFLETRGLAEHSIQRALEHGLEHEVERPNDTLPGCILPLSDKLRKVIIEADCVAREAEQSHARPEDLLIGLLKEGTNEAASLLTCSGISLHKIYHHFQYPQRRPWYRLKHWLGLI